MAYQINLTGQEIDERLQNVGTPADNPDANGTLFARQNKNVDDIDELSDAVLHIQDAQEATDKTVTQHTENISTLQTALKTKANLVLGKVSVKELPVATSLANPNNGTIPSTFAVSKAINDKIVGLLNWQGVKDTTDEIKDIALAKKGDVWHSNEDGSEWICTEDIFTADHSVWEELGTPIDLSGYYTKNEVDKKFTAEEFNASRQFNGVLIQKLTTASTEADIRKAFTEVNTKTVLFPTPGSVITNLNGNNKGIVVSLSEPDATTLGRSIVVYYGDGTYTIVVKNDFTKVLVPWRKDSSLRDLYISAGAKYNEATGFYELNGLTDITEEEMRVIWQEDLSGWYLNGRTNLTRNISTRGNAGGYNGGIDICNICRNNKNITIFNFGQSPFARWMDNAFSGCTKLETIDTRFPIIPYGGIVGPNMFRNCSALKEVRFNMVYIGYSTNVNFPASPLISKDSVLSVIKTTKTDGSVKPLVVVGLNESAYNRLKDDTDIIAALTEKNGFVTITQI